MELLFPAFIFCMTIGVPIICLIVGELMNQKYDALHAVSETEDKK